jgi:hypothetical protein
MKRFIEASVVGVGASLLSVARVKAQGQISFDNYLCDDLHGAIITFAPDSGEPAG